MSLRIPKAELSKCLAVKLVFGQPVLLISVHASPLVRDDLRSP